MFSVTVNGSSLGELQSNLKNLLSQFDWEGPKNDGSELGYSLPVEQSYVEDSEDDATYEEPVKILTAAPAGPVIEQVAPPAFVAPVPFTAEVTIQHATPVAPPVIPQQTVTSATVDSKGMPYDQRIHSATKATNRDGSWRYRRGIEEATIAQVEAELKGQPAPSPFAAPAETPALEPERRLVTPSQPYIPPRATAPPVVTALPQGYDAPPVAPPPPPIDIKPAHTFDTFKAQMIQTIADLVDAKKINAEYLQLLKNHFKVAELWDVRKDDAKCFDLFNGLVENGLITKVG